MKQRYTQGFTLIELMVVVVVIAILASIAYPSYRDYMFRARRAEGRTLLMNIAAAQERHFTNNNRYAATITGAPPNGLGLVTPPPPAFPPNVSENNLYQIVIGGLGVNNQTYTLTVTPVLGRPQQFDECATITLDNLGQRGFTDADVPPMRNGTCW